LPTARYAIDKLVQMLSQAGMNVRILVTPQAVDVASRSENRYEVRRELLRSNKVKGIRRLDELIDLVEYFSISTEIVG
jgi:hypothetical protein